jgi:hypothetical protein
MSTAIVDDRGRLAGELHEAGKILLELESARRHPYPADELVELETRIARQRARVDALQEEFAVHVRQADQEAARARAAAEDLRVARRAELEEQQRPALVAARDDALRAVQAATAELCAAAAAAVEVDRVIFDIDGELTRTAVGEEYRPGQTRPIELRLGEFVGSHLYDVGVKELGWTGHPRFRAPLVDELDQVDEAGAEGGDAP